MTAPVKGMNGVGSQHGLAPVPGKVAFRRTYSSNSIKVRQVRWEKVGTRETYDLYFYNAGGSRTIEFPKDQNVGQRRRGQGVSCAREENE